MSAIKIKYLNRSGNWKFYGYLEGNYSQNDTKIIEVLIYSKAIRIYPVEFHNKITMKADIAIKTHHEEQDNSVIKERSVDERKVKYIEIWGYDTNHN